MKQKKRPEPFGSRRLCLFSYAVKGADRASLPDAPDGPEVSMRLAICVDQPGRPDHIEGGVVWNNAGVVPAWCRSLMSDRAPRVSGRLKRHQCPGAGIGMAGQAALQWCATDGLRCKGVHGRGWVVDAERHWMHGHAERSSLYTNPPQHRSCPSLCVGMPPVTLRVTNGTDCGLSEPGA